MQIAMKSVKKLVKVKLSQNEFDALVDFAYNTGGGKNKDHNKGFESSELLKQVNKGNYDGSPFFHYLIPKDILYRREDEYTLFTNGQYYSHCKPIKIH
jgi:GH24 family phage-related lysozyme (muramidase)